MFQSSPLFIQIYALPQPSTVPVFCPDYSSSDPDTALYTAV